jgi:hypothetical protein
VRRHGAAFLDAGRALERWLLGTAGPAVEPALRDYVEAELDR